MKTGDQGKKEYRLKVYNKFVHLLTCGQYKKKINMALDDLLLPGLSFYQDKIRPCLDEGLSRIELSNYFYSTQNYVEKFGAIKDY